jgi:hypothetical protein
MQSALIDVPELKDLSTPTIRGFCVGQIVQITREGRALVDYPGNPTGPIEARSVLDAPSTHGNYSEGGMPVLLFFENGDSALPIIVGLIRDTLYPSTPLEEAVLPLERPGSGVIDGRKIVFDAKEEIMLCCGKSSVLLRKDGKIVVKGSQIISRASGTNKIKGAAVRIN